MQAGILRDRIYIQRKTGAKDRFNTALPDAWENITAGRIAANVEHQGGLSTIKADADVSIVRASVRVRRRADVCADMRIQFGSAIYVIDAVLPGKSREYMDLVCRQVL